MTAPDLTAVKAMLLDALNTATNPGDQVTGYHFHCIDADNLAATVNAFYADHYYRLAIREHTLFGQLGQFREAVADAFAPITTRWNKLAATVAAWFAAREGGAA